MPFEMYVNFGSIFIVKITIRAGTPVTGDLNPSSTSIVVMKDVLNSEERQRYYFDSEAFDSTDGASFLTMFSRPCLQILGISSSPILSLMSA